MSSFYCYWSVIFWSLCEWKNGGEIALKMCVAPWNNVAVLMFKTLDLLNAWLLACRAIFPCCNKMGDWSGCQSDPEFIYSRDHDPRRVNASTPWRREATIKKIGNFCENHASVLIFQRPASHNDAGSPQNFDSFSVSPGRFLASEFAINLFVEGNHICEVFSTQPYWRLLYWLLAPVRLNRKKFSRIVPNAPRWLPFLLANF